MKDFTTAEYVDPVLDWFREKYNPVTDNVTLVSDTLHCELLLKGKHSNDYKAVRKNDVFFVYCPPVKKVYEEIKEFAEMASTYDGELDDWKWEEQQRFQNAIRDRLLEIYL